MAGTPGRCARRAVTLWVGVLLLAGCATTPKEQTKPAPPARPSVSAAPEVKTGTQRTNEAGRAIIRESEGLHLRAYQDGGQWFIGFGHAEGATQGQTITQDQAEAYLKTDLALCENKVSAALTRPATSNEFSAMVSLCFNIGWQPFTASSVVTRFNAGDKPGAADAFMLWTKARVNGMKTVLPRLEARRQRERTLFLTPDAQS